VTALHPRGRAGAGDPVAAAFFSKNGNGEMTGVSWIEESGTFSGDTLAIACARIIDTVNHARAGSRQPASRTTPNC
jgi:L-aminopeptidase/D-esterase-like protein